MRHPKNTARPATRLSSAGLGAWCAASKAWRPSTFSWLYIAWISWSITAGWMPKSSGFSRRWAKVCRWDEPWKRLWKTALFPSRTCAIAWKVGSPLGRKWVGYAGVPNQTLQPADRRGVRPAIAILAPGAALLGIPDDANRLGQAAQPGEGHRFLHQSRHTAARRQCAFHRRAGILKRYPDHAGARLAAICAAPYV